MGVYILLATELRTRTILLNWSATTMWLLSSFAGTFSRCRWLLSPNHGTLYGDGGLLSVHAG